MIQQGVSAYLTHTVFSSEVGSTELDLRATVFLPEHCSAFCFLVQKIVQKMIN
jgi:hypothetical protein